MGQEHLKTEVCAHHDLMQLRWASTKESLDSHTELLKGLATSLANQSKDYADLKAEVAGIGAKLTLAFVVATPIWAALAGVIVKVLAGFKLG